MKTEILGVSIDNLGLGEVIEQINEMLDSGSGNLIATVNPEFILQAQKNEDFRKALNSAAIATADGFGLICAGLFLWRVRLQRVTGVDLCQKLLEGSCPEAKIFLLGGREGVADAVRTKYLNSWIVGGESGGELIEGQPILLDNQIVIERINSSGANLLLVAFGQVKQEMWIKNNLLKMPGVRVAIGVGGTFDYLSGSIRRAPKFIRILGTEWLYRLIKEPKRWKRIWNATIVFSWSVILNKIRNSIRNS